MGKLSIISLLLVCNFKAPEWEPHSLFLFCWACVLAILLLVLGLTVMVARDLFEDDQALRRRQSRLNLQNSSQGLKRSNKEVLLESDSKQQSTSSQDFK